MKVERQVLHHFLATAKEHLKKKELDLARDNADMGIIFIAQRRSGGLRDDDEIEGVRVGLWLERFWLFLENNNLML